MRSSSSTAKVQFQNSRDRKNRGCIRNPVRPYYWVWKKAVGQRLSIFKFPMFRKKNNKIKIIDENYFNPREIRQYVYLICLDMCILIYNIIGENSTWRKKYVWNFSNLKSVGREIPGCSSPDSEVLSHGYLSIPGGHWKAFSINEKVGKEDTTKYWG